MQGRDQRVPKVIIPGGDPNDWNNREQRKTIKLGWGDKSLEVRGYDLIVIACVVAMSLGSYFMYQLLEDNKQIKVSFTEMIYILALTPEERAKLNIQMPPSLRHKVQKRDSYDRNERNENQ